MEDGEDQRRPRFPSPPPNLEECYTHGHSIPKQTNDQSINRSITEPKPIHAHAQPTNLPCQAKPLTGFIHEDHLWQDPFSHLASRNQISLLSSIRPTIQTRFPIINQSPFSHPPPHLLLVRVGPSPLQCSPGDDQIPTTPVRSDITFPRM
ncbi:hypothetical protein IE53DRAFT_258678 [Violaceomyces palustris]|uniref:Uncharacterized protein n=1 Tax=Violaceomyces palustris TaxID=1673888 RepID=A0ACD0P3L5_9BASI|nr:hypothetical protein IE53DRAFT_258678 [Violaceomyces palustris]